MDTTEPVMGTNRLVTSLPSKERKQLLENCEPIQLFFGEELYRAGESIPHVYFPTGSSIALINEFDGVVNLELSMIGYEGMLGISLIMGFGVAPFRAIVQISGTALRITTSDFLRELKRCPMLQREMNRYLYFSLKQLAQTTVCIKFHVLEQRLALWLLMAQDRTQSDTLHVTQLFLSYLLGVRREGVTEAANSLKMKKIISYRRGDITILNRGGLEEASCGCYRLIKRVEIQRNESVRYHSK